MELSGSEIVAMETISLLKPKMQPRRKQQLLQQLMYLKTKKQTSIWM